MPLERIYLDFNATAPMRPAVRTRVIECLDMTGNPSSIHAEGRRARLAVEEARREIARLLGTGAAQVVFTSGATEAAALALSPELTSGSSRSPAERLLLGATEHPAVMQGHRFPPDRVTVVPVARNGVIDLQALAELLEAEPGRVVLALQAANSETGVLQPVAEAAAMVHARGGLLVCDIAQAAGRIDCRAGTLGADVVFLSAHKLGGPQGVGALAMLTDAVRLGPPLVRGGGQERGMRGGTENVAAIAGFGAAAREAAGLAESEPLQRVRDDLERRLHGLAPDLVVFGADAPRLPNTSAFAVPGLGNDTLLIALDLAGIAVSTGSACSSGKVSRSPVLEAMGVDTHLSLGLIRVSLGWSSTTADATRFIHEFETVSKRLRRRDLKPAA